MQVVFFWKSCRRKSLPFKKNMAPWPRFKKLNKAQDLLNIVLWTDETKVQMFVHYAQNWIQHVSTNTSDRGHGGGGIMIWAPCSHWTCLYTKLLYSQASVLQLKLKPNWFINRTKILSSAENLESQGVQTPSWLSGKSPVKTTLVSSESEIWNLPVFSLLTY